MTDKDIELMEQYYEMIRCYETSQDECDRMTYNMVAALWQKLWESQ